MNRDKTVRGAALTLLAAGAACSALALPLAQAEPVAPEPVVPVEAGTASTPAPAPAADTPGATPMADAPDTAAPAVSADDGCTAAGLSRTLNSVTGALSTYFAKNPDVNAALLDATRQPAFVAVGQMDSYFADHPQQADEVRAIKAPLNDFQNRCGLQVSPAEALVALSDL